MATTALPNWRVGVSLGTALSASAPTAISALWARRRNRWGQLAARWSPQPRLDWGGLQDCSRSASPPSSNRTRSLRPCSRSSRSGDALRDGHLRRSAQGRVGGSRAPRRRPGAQPHSRPSLLVAEFPERRPTGRCSGAISSSRRSCAARWPGRVSCSATSTSVAAAKCFATPTRRSRPISMRTLVPGYLQAQIGRLKLMGFASPLLPGDKRDGS